MTSFWQYYWKVIGRSVRGKLGLADLITGIAAVILGVLVFLVEWIDGTLEFLILGLFLSVLLVLFIIGFLKAHYDLFRKVEEDLRGLRDSRPAIVVSPVVKNNRAILEVHNRGNAATFTAKGRVLSGYPESELYTMYWESVPTPACRIDAAAVASILVAGSNPIRDVTAQVVGYVCVCFKMGTSGEQMFDFGTQTDTEEVRFGDGIIDVTITATPPLLVEFHQKYNLLCDGGVVVDFSPLAPSPAGGGR